VASARAAESATLLVCDPSVHAAICNAISKTDEGFVFGFSTIGAKTLSKRSNHRLTRIICKYHTTTFGYARGSLLRFSSEALNQDSSETWPYGKRTSTDKSSIKSLQPKISGQKLVPASINSTHNPNG
jgi:hypothetical protein